LIVTHLWLRQIRSTWLLVPVAFSLAAFAWLLTPHPCPQPKLSGVYISLAIVFLWTVKSVPSTTRDRVGVGRRCVGMIVDMFGPRYF
jgi:small multidrug resistance family-3 protein